MGELELLKEHDWVDFWRSYGGIGSLSLTTRGVMKMSDIEESVSTITTRRIALRDIYLSWLYEQIDGRDQRPSPQDFVATRPSILGEPFTDTDVERAGEWLASNGFIKGTAAMQYAGPLRPDLTEKGRWTVENQRSVNDPAPGVGGTTINNSGNIAFGSPGAQQVVLNDSVWIEQGSKLAAALEEAVPVLPAELADEAHALIAELREQLQGTPEPSKVRTVLTKVGSFFGQASVGALGSLLATQAQALLDSLL